MNTTPIQLEFIQLKSGEDIKPLNQEELKLKKVSQDFEALFLSHLMKSMRETVLTDEDALFSSSSERSGEAKRLFRAEKIYTSMLDEQYAQEMAKSDGVGIWKVVFEQLRGSVETGKTAADAKIRVVIPADEVQSEDSVANTNSEIAQPDDNSQQPEVPIVVWADIQQQPGENKLPSETKQNSQSDSAERNTYILALSNSIREIISDFYNPSPVNGEGLHQEIVVEAAVPVTTPSESAKSVERLPAEGTPSKQQSANNQEVVTATQAHIKQAEANPENRQVDTLIAAPSKQPSMATEKRLTSNLEGALRHVGQPHQVDTTQPHGVASTLQANESPRQQTSLRAKSQSTIAESPSQTTESESPTVLYVRQFSRIVKPISDFTFDNPITGHAKSADGAEVTQLALSAEKVEQTQTTQDNSVFPDVELKTQRSEGEKPLFIEPEQGVGKPDNSTSDSSPRVPNGIPLEEGEFNPKFVTENLTLETNIESTDVQIHQVESRNPSSAMQIDKAANSTSDATSDNPITGHADTADDIASTQQASSDENTEQMQTAQKNSDFLGVPRSELNTQRSGGVKPLFIETEQGVGKPDNSTSDSSPRVPNGIPLEEGVSNSKSVTENLTLETNIESPDVQIPQVEPHNTSSAMQIDKAANSTSDATSDNPITGHADTVDDIVSTQQASSDENTEQMQTAQKNSDLPGVPRSEMNTQRSEGVKPLFIEPEQGVGKPDNSTSDSSPRVPNGIPPEEGEFNPKFVTENLTLETNIESPDVQIPQVEPHNTSSAMQIDKAANSTGDVTSGNPITGHADTVDDITSTQQASSDENIEQTQTAQNNSDFLGVPRSELNTQRSGGVKPLFIEPEQGIGKPDNSTSDSSPPAPNGIPVEKGEFNSKFVTENLTPEVNIERPDVQVPQVDTHKPPSEMQIDRVAKPDSDVSLANKPRLVHPDVIVPQREENSIQLEIPDSTDTDVIHNNRDFISSDTTQVSEFVRGTQESAHSEALQDVIDSSQVGETKNQTGREQKQNVSTEAASRSHPKETNERLDAKLPQEATNTERNIVPIDDKPPVAKRGDVTTMVRDLPTPTAGGVVVPEAKGQKDEAVVQNNLSEEETDGLKNTQPSNQPGSTLERGGRLDNPPESKTRKLTNTNLKNNSVQNEGTARSEVKRRSSPSQTLMQKFDPLLATARSIAEGQNGLSQSQRTDILRNAVLEQIVPKMRIVRTNTSSQITIQLEPPELGRLNMRIVLEGNTLTARFEAQNEFVANVIRGNLAQLDAALSHHGIKVSGFEVSVSGGQSQLFHDNQDSNPSYIKDRRRRIKDNNIKSVDAFIPVSQLQQHIVDYRL